MEKNRPQLVFCANVLRYTCGCILEWQFIGTYAHIPEYHVIPCFFHASTEGREEMEDLAEEDWERITSQVTK